MLADSAGERPRASKKGRCHVNVRSGLSDAPCRFTRNLQRDVASELRIAGAIHLPHAAFTDLRDVFVDAESGAGGEGQL